MSNFIAVLVWLAPDVGIKAAEIEKTHKATAVFLWSSKNWTRQVHILLSLTKKKRKISKSKYSLSVY